MYFLVVFATLCCASLTSAKTPLYSLSSSSYPVLSASVDQLSATPSYSGTDSVANLYGLNLYTMQQVYANFTARDGPKLRRTARRIRSLLFTTNNRSPLTQLENIPKMLSFYSPVFQCFARGTNMVYAWQLGTKNPTGRGPFIYFTTNMWSTVLQGLQTFGSSALGVTQNLMQMEYQTSFILDNLKRQKEDIFIRRRYVNNLDAANAQLAQSIQGVRNGLQQIYSVHKMGATKIQNSKRSARFLGYYFQWLKELIAVYSEMAPNKIDFSSSLKSIGNITRTKPREYNFEIANVNNLYKGTAKRMAYLSRVLADYFQNFNQEIQSMWA